MVVYRGSLKSCNYHCSYCPFSKHEMTKKELAKDREQWLSFVKSYMGHADKSECRALMLAPYGEALIYPWYWEGLARISALSWTEAVGAQTNLGFRVGESVRVFQENGGSLAKLRLWATFHPKMAKAEEFVKNCMQLAAAGVQISVGAVGVPAHAALLLQLRKELPEEIYLWINRMDGLGRAYTAEEVQVFSDIDPYFYRELQPHPADALQCQKRLFVQGDGKIRMCNISSASDADGKDFFPYKTGMENRALTCRRKRCACYLAYGGRENLVNQMLFGPWPLFRIPRRPKAVFLDIEGTLLSGGNISADMQEALQVLSKREGTLLFFATTLPHAEARKRCGSVWHLFSGGVFAAGAHILLHSAENRKEFYYDMDEEIIKYLETFARKLHFRMLAYQNEEGHVYKITLLRAHRNPWDRQGVQEVLGCLPAPARSKVRYLMEGQCMQIVAAGAGKAAGVKMICSWQGIPLKEMFASGDSKEDAEMMELCGMQALL